jgi:hypothetical protein
VLWATNVIAFALWYWDLDRGGAAARAHHPQANPAFIFPEILHTQYVPATWVPNFVDYLSLGFWTATAFSPTDISAIKPWNRRPASGALLDRADLSGSASAGR